MLGYEQTEDFSNSQIDALEAAGGTIEVDTGSNGTGEFIFEWEAK